VPDDLIGFAIVAAACVLGATALAIAVRCSKAVQGVVAVLLATAPLLGVIWQVWR
jgi:hypothetical protein